MKKIAIVWALLAALVAGVSGGALVEPASALAKHNDTLSAPTAILGTFDVVEQKDNVSVQIGSNLLLAGNSVINETTVRGILFAFGNDVSAGAKAEYSFIAGNNVNIAGVIEKDLFAAGNSVRIDDTAEIGRDVYVAANKVALDADLKRDFSASADVVVLDNVKIDGDVDLAVSRLLVNGDKVEITGTLIINADAEIVNSSSEFIYGGIDKYEVVHYDIAPTAIITVKTISIVGLFVVMLILLLIFPQINKKVAKEISGKQMLIDMAVGFCLLVLIPVLCVFLVLTIIAVPAAILLIAIYLIMLYLARGFSGLWLGKLIVERILGWEGHKLFETLLGIVIFGFATLAPVVGGWISLFSLLLGLGLMVQSIKNKQIGRGVDWGPKDAEEITVAEAEVVKPKTKKTTSKTRSSSARKTTTKKSKKAVKEED